MEKNIIFHDIFATDWQRDSERPWLGCWESRRMDKQFESNCRAGRKSPRSRLPSAFGEKTGKLWETTDRGYRLLQVRDRPTSYCHSLPTWTSRTFKTSRTFRTSRTSRTSITSIHPSIHACIQTYSHTDIQTCRQTNTHTLYIYSIHLQTLTTTHPHRDTRSCTRTHTQI